MRDRTVPVILPDSDSDELQQIYRQVAKLVEEYNAQNVCQIMCVQFDAVGGNFGGRQRDYHGTYVYRDRSAVL